MVEAEHLRAIEAGDHIERERLGRVVSRRVDLVEFFTKHLARALAAVGEACLELPLHEREGIGVVVGRAEFLVEELQRGFEVSWSRGTVDGLDRLLD